MHSSSQYCYTDSRLNKLKINRGKKFKYENSIVNSAILQTVS